MTGLIAFATVLVHALAPSSTSGHSTSGNKLTQEYNSSLSHCDLGSSGVIVELIPQSVATRRRHLKLEGKSRADRYLDKLRLHIQQTPHLRKLSSSLLMVHGTFSTLVDGFAATLDEQMLQYILNDPEEVAAVEANWCVRSPV